MRQLLIATVACACVLLLGIEIFAGIHHGSNGTVVYVGQSFPVTAQTPDKFDLTQTPQGQMVQFSFKVCCENCGQCPAGSTCGVAWGSDMTVTDGVNSVTVPIGGGIHCTACSPIKAVIGLIGGSRPITGVTLNVSSFCRCCGQDGESTWSGDLDEHQIELDPDEA